jgi:hypothetical protein
MKINKNDTSAKVIINFFTARLPVDSSFNFLQMTGRVSFAYELILELFNFLRIDILNNH